MGTDTMLSQAGARRKAVILKHTKLIQKQKQVDIGTNLLHIVAMVFEHVSGNR